MIFRARAPLRLGLAGGGTDLSPFCDQYGGYVLNATINMHAYAHIETASDGRVRFTAPDVGHEYAGPARPELESRGPLALHKAVYNRIVQDYNGGEPLALSMRTHYDAPPGSGLGSSSTLVVAMIKAYAEWLRLPLGEYDMAKLAFEIERCDLGLSGGRQDQYAAAFGGFNFMEFYGGQRVVVNPLRVKNWIISELEASIVLFQTGASRASADIIDQQTENVRAQHDNALAGMQALKENALAMKEALLKGDFRQFAFCLGQSWEAKKRTADCITTGRIEKVLGRGHAAGAIAGKVSGAGGGGYIVFVVDPARRMELVRALNASEGQVVPCHFTKNGTEGWRLD